MKKQAAAAIILILAVYAAGCLGTVPEKSTVAPEQQPDSTTTGGPKSPQEIPTGRTQTVPQGEQAAEKRFPGIEWVRQVSYEGNVTIHMRVTVEQGNTSQEGKVSLLILEHVYLDFASWSASVNSTTVSLPDGAEVDTSRIIVNNVTYLMTPEGWIKVEDPLPAEVFWKTNIISLAKEGRVSRVELRNGTLVAVYDISPDLVKDLARAYFEVTPGAELIIRNIRLEIYFRNGAPVKGTLSFEVTSKAEVDSNTPLGKLSILQKGNWTQTVEITSINEKSPVKPPST
ncbi:hypothetical protein E3E36_04805 [Thermococcus sp. M36]|uniref:hypothetical protein n=1 Tax=Thermococcus sp. M36 TaxID=1638261 RepID=UPI00143C6A1E|nr:hypothetical protein [Thermococcus sp. M36]NJE05472.1 hypothetical protein [Thermococcus sp. M36]